MALIFAISGGPVIAIESTDPEKPPVPVVENQIPIKVEKESASNSAAADKTSTANSSEEKKPGDTTSTDGSAKDPALNPETGENQPVPEVPVEKVNSSDDIPARTLFLRMDQVTNAKEYEIQIRPAGKAWADPYKIKTTKDKLRFRVTPGHYSIRTRSLDDNDKPGRWADWKSFWVPFRQPVGVFPGEGAEITPKGTLSERLTFEWPKVPGAKAYRVKLYDENNKLFKHMVIPQNWVAITLNINKRYSWSLKPLGSPNEPDIQGDTNIYNFAIMEPEKSLVPIKLAISQRPRTMKYQFELVRMVGPEETSEPTIYESREPVFKSRLAPGEYELRVRSLYETGNVSSWGVPTKFWVRIPKVALESPVKDELLDPVHDTANPVELRWEASKFADKYRVLIYDENKNLVHSGYSKTNTYIAPLAENRRYTWSVQPMLAREEERAPASVGEGQESFQIDKYIRMSLSEAEEPSQFFAWGRSIVSNTKYVAENYDNNNRVSQSMIASTAETAMGYWHRKSQFGALALAGLSGINVGGTSAFYNHGGLLLGYRKIYEDNRRWRIWLGPAYKETPEVVVNGETRGLSIQKITNYGPQFLTAFLNSFNSNWGYQTYLGIYYGMKGLSTPNGLDQERYWSYSGSAYLTYKFNPSTTGLIGYTYQVDEAGYGTTDPKGIANHVYFNGNYLSFSLIWGLQDPLP